MEANRGPQYTERQLLLLKGEVEPKDDEEWKYLHEHANDVLPKDQKTFRPFSITGEDLERSRQFDKGSTQAGHIGEALDRKTKFKYGKRNTV